MKLTAQEKKWIAAIKKSNRFDRDFYRRWYGDDPEVRGALERHYVLKGEIKGYWPCSDFCPELYLTANSDVAEAGVSPFYHYVTSGRPEGRLLRPQCLPRELADENGGGQLIESFECSGRKARFAIVVHIYHYGMWPGIAERIDSLADDVDLFVTVAKRREGDFEKLAATIKEAFPNAAVFLHPNHGRDIFPFIRLINSGVLSDYEAVCKIHTKKSPHLESGKAWGDHLVSSLLPGSGKSSELIKSFLSTGRCGVLTAEGQKKSGSEWWHGNRGRTLNLLARVGIRADPKRLCFPAGSMYWLKPKMVEALKNLKLSAEDFEPEMGQGDATTAHAVERIFGYLAENENLEVVEKGELMGQLASRDDLKSYEFCEPDDLLTSASQDLASQPLGEVRLPPVSRFVRYKGTLESCSPRGVVGWICEMSDREVACRILLSIDGIMIVEGFADQYRSDLGERDELASYCGFVLPLPDRFFDGQMHSFQIAVLGDAWSYQSLCFRTRLALKEDLGEVKENINGEVIGSCHDPLDVDFKQDVDLLIDGYFAGGTEFPDSNAVGHGFRLKIPPSFRDGKKHDLKVVVRGSRVCLWEGVECL